MLFNNAVNPVSILRYLGVIIEFRYILEFYGFRHHPIRLSIFTHQWTTRVSLKVNKQYVIASATVNALSLLTKACLSMLCYINIRTSDGPISPREQYKFSFANFLSSMSVTLTSMSESVINGLSILLLPQPETIHDFG